jgi:PhzF family phenazine biosynthesis protein
VTHAAGGADQGPDVLRYAAFTDTPEGGNPAGVVLDACGLDAHAMQAIAAEVGYSETAFLTPAGDDGRTFNIRYFAPSIEVPFCGHATIATAVALGERLGEGHFLLHAESGDVPVEVDSAEGGLRATLTTVEPELRALEAADLNTLLNALRWTPEELDPTFPPKVAYAGVWHPVLAVRTRARLADLNYNFDAVRTLMAARGWTTIQLVWREAPTIFHVRDPFAVAGVVEDPATGAGAAALGHYLRETGLIEPPVTLTLHQGVDMGRPSLLIVDVDDVDPRIRVGGHAVAILEAT